MGLEKIVPDIARLVESRVGIKRQAVGNHSWIRALRTRMEVTDIERPAIYYQKVQSSVAEFQALLELLVVPETWFYRERAAIDFFTNYVKQRELQGFRSTWQVVSLGCASGEEPYSIAMSLADSGLSLLRFSVTGVDVSEVNIQKAREAVYGGNSFRTNQTLMHRRHLETTERGYQVASPIRQRVSFVRGNIVSSGITVAGQPFDAIFCRNVLIYFDSAIQQRVWASMERLLKKDGMIFVGLAERELLRSAGFVPTGPVAACAFLRRDSEEKGSALIWQKAAIKKRIKVAAKKIVPTQSIQTERTETKQPFGTVPSEIGPKQLLTQAMKKADEGCTKEALNLCREYVTRYGASADACYLMGTLALANHEEDIAKEYYQKAVYLVPNHYDALVGLAILAERSHDKEQAIRYWNRARKQQTTQKQTEGARGKR